MKVLIKLLFTIFTIQLLGCKPATVGGASYRDFKQPEIKNDLAHIYIYRANNGQGFKLGTVNITVDNHKPFEINDTQFTSFYIKPGTHSFKSEWSFWDKPLFEGGNFDAKTLTANIKAGESYYINYSINTDNKPDTFLEKESIVGKAFSSTHVLSAGLVVEHDKIGIKNLQKCWHIENTINF